MLSFIATFYVLVTLNYGCIVPMQALVPMENGRDAFYLADWAEGKLTDAQLRELVGDRLDRVMIQCKGVRA
ncbi:MULTISPECIES: hypothetical protein [unclassified Beijerinckia]|uniref:hypothetical protein n=1 Tax=unclassified Beijerinckia TaxID=2638183 RepID=UPI00089AEF88|nr:MULTISPECIES: hypothetical protein [unclassified Beijerinckia]MDH7796462.1 hypothetical protein [Beijerinckia sp. GAS462]SEC46120.1 hypothetical protein SAMN05443249_2744 [Beijerinckia sp. 28-YEA-48]